MSDSKQSFTPGPWTWGRRPSGYCEALIGNGDDVFRVDEYAGAAWIDVSEDNARLIASAPDLYEAAEFSKAAIEALRGYEADAGEELPDDHEIGRIEDSRHSASFRIRVGHIRRLAAAIAKAGG